MATQALSSMPVVRMPVTYQGRVWPSYVDLARHYKLSPDTVRNRILKGRPLEVRRINGRSGRR